MANANELFGAELQRSLRQVLLADDSFIQDTRQLSDYDRLSACVCAPTRQQNLPAHLNRLQTV